MCKLKLLCIILFGIFCSVEGQEFWIKTEFCNGNLIFSWTNTANRKYMYFTSNLKTTKWEEVQSGQSQYTVHDVMQYKFAQIFIRVYNTVGGGYLDYNKTYRVVIVESVEGESQRIHWKIAKFPNAGFYTIFHTFNNETKALFTINKNYSPQEEQPKYIYYSTPFNSSDIDFEVKNIGTKDAGYYSGGRFKYNALFGKGVILAVKRKPEKPRIAGDNNVTVNGTATLTCKSKSTSLPDYYSRRVSMIYTWYINDTTIQETRKTCKVDFSEALKYNKYRCQARENGLNSKLSDEKWITPLYGPYKITIISQKPTNGILTVREGEKIGPFNCTADCNPPCTIQWEIASSKRSNSNVVYRGGTLEEQIVKRDMELFRCVAHWNTTVTKKRPVKLNIQYISVPKFYLNGSRYNSNFLIREKDRLELSCHSEGNPTPSISVTKIPDLTMPGQSVNGWFNHTFPTLNCSNTGTYNCKGNSFETKETNITINVTCTLRLDTSEYFKSTYGSMSGPDVTLKVRVPVISNPPLSAQGISWTGPGSLTIRSQSLEQRENIAYKQWVLSTIPVKNKTYFGNYTMKYLGQDITTITINAEDKPEPPLNFSWYSYAAGYINLTWVSKFNGGPEQLFILSRKDGSSWTIVKNLSDPGAGKMGYHDLGPLNPGQEYLYKLDSCNRINCSLSPKEVKVKVEAPPISSSSLFGDNTMLILVGASAAGFLLVVVLTLAVTMYCKTTKKSATKKRNRQEGLSGSTVQDDTPADVVVYAAVDKSVLMKNRQQDDVVKSDVIKDQNDDNDTMYSEVIKHPKKLQTDEKKKNEEKELKEKNEEAGASTSNDNSRSTNQDGLVYIDVEFARKPPSSDTKGRPVIHGEDEKTEYTFVDFSQKAPSVQETRENVK